MDELQHYIDEVKPFLWVCQHVWYRCDVIEHIRQYVHMKHRWVFFLTAKTDVSSALAGHVDVLLELYDSRGMFQGDVSCVTRVRSGEPLQVDCCVMDAVNKLMAKRLSQYPELCLYG